jgi:hypothetical protein
MQVHPPMTVYERYMAEFRAQDAAARERHEVFQLLYRYQLIFSYKAPDAE